MVQDRSTIILLSLVCGAIAGGAIAGIVTSFMHEAPAADARDPEILARLADIADRLKTIHADLAGGVQTNEPSRALQTGAPSANDDKVVASLEAIRAELKLNTTAIKDVARRGTLGETGIAVSPATIPEMNTASVSNLVKLVEARDPSVKKRFLLMKPEDVLAELGRPTEISKNDNGLVWNYDADGDESPDLFVFIQSGYVYDVQ